MTNELLVVTAGRHARLEAVLKTALQGVPFRRYDMAGGALPDLRQRRVLFAIAVDQAGIDPEVCRLLMLLRQSPDAMQGACGALLIDGAGELYTKQTAQALLLAANLAGCWLMGKPLLEATGSLQNLDIRAKKLGLSHRAAYDALAVQLVRRLLEFAVPGRPEAKLLMLHASNQKLSLIHISEPTRH